MFQYLYDWMVNVAFYLVIFTAVIQLLPNTSYHKYVRFFSGLILIVLVVSPVFKILGMEHSFQDFYQSSQYEQEQKEIEQSARFLEDVELFDFLPEEYPVSEEAKEQEGKINVEEIRIGE